MVIVVEGYGRELGTVNRPLYGEKIQTLILLALRKTILGHFELSHASTTILGLVHLFIFYVFPSNEAQETDLYSCLWHLSLEEKQAGWECMSECVTALHCRDVLQSGALSQTTTGAMTQLSYL